MFWSFFLRNAGSQLCLQFFMIKMVTFCHLLSALDPSNGSPPPSKSPREKRNKLSTNKQQQKHANDLEIIHMTKTLQNDLVLSLLRLPPPLLLQFKLIILPLFCSCLYMSKTLWYSDKLKHNLAWWRILSLLVLPHLPEAWSSTNVHMYIVTALKERASAFSVHVLPRGFLEQTKIGT